MSHVKGMHPGAVWKKCDLQVHTPRDPQWDGAHFGGGTPEKEVERELWADQFIAACLAKQLQAVAITDHHDLCAMPYITRAIARLPLSIEKPWIFPGMEITCDDSAQCLVVFDVHSDEQLWGRLFGGHLPNIAAPSQTAAMAPQAMPCGLSIDEFLEQVSKDILLSKRLIVLPNAGNDGSHKTIIRQGFAPRFRDIPFDGVYTDKGFSALKPVTLQKIYGQISQWGTRRRGVFPTGDNRLPSFQNLGVHDCWVKLGEPTAESLRQAVLADEARITYGAPQLPSQRILELHVASTLCGSDFRIALNDGFTAFIGGRGSGKSAILEYLRFGIGRSIGDTSAEDDEDTERQRNLITDTLSNGSVTVKLERDGVGETWVRSGIASDVIEIQIEGTPPEKISIEAAQQRFRARAFSQKQLSTLVNSRKMAAEQITGIAAAESIDKRQSLEQDIVKAKRAVATVFQKVVQLWSAESDSSISAGLVLDLERRRAAVKKKLEDSGLGADKQAILDQAPAFKAAQTLFAEVGPVISGDTARIQALELTIPAINPDAWSRAAAFLEATDFLTEVAKRRQLIAALFTQCRNELATLEEFRQAFEAQFKVKLDIFVPAYKDIREQQASMKSLMEEGTRIDRELDDAEKQDRRNKEAVARLVDAKDELLLARKLLDEKMDELRVVLMEAASQVSLMSGGSLKALVKQETMPRQHVEALGKVCENQRVRDISLKCEDRVKGALATSEGWNEVVTSFMIVYEGRVKGNRNLGTPVASTKVIADLQSCLFPLTAAQAQGIYAGLDDSKVSALLTAATESFITFEYKDRGSFIAFEKASPGQQAAALLHLLLRQEAGTLIIDQPEDDLDNKIIMDIVKLVTTAKRKRQLIFTTHNANFVVNGDADKVVALMPGGNNISGGNAPVYPIDIEVDGSIETLAVRTLISDTVEGGQDAFELRARKYLYNKVH